MAVLAPKISSYASTMGLGSAQTPSVGQFSAGPSNHRIPAIGTSHHAPFASPTESEFSEGYDGPDSVR